MKKIIILFAFMLWGAAIFAQTHTVARGESLQSIAAKYNITEAQLLEANPGADQLFYIGLKLNIPQSVGNVSNTTSTTTSTDSQSQPSATQAPTSPSSSSGNTEDFDDKPGFNYMTMIEYGFLPKAEGTSDTNYTYSISFGVYYYFMHRQAGLFAGARIGYNSASYNGKVKLDRFQYIFSSSEAHFITIPISVGYTFATKNRSLAVIPYVGIDPNFCVAGKYEESYYDSGTKNKIEGKFKKKVGFDARIGAQLRIYGVHLGVSYVIPLNDAQKSYFGEDSYVAINLGFGF